MPEGTQNNTLWYMGGEKVLMMAFLPGNTRSTSDQLEKAVYFLLYKNSFIYSKLSLLSF